MKKRICSVIMALGLIVLPVINALCVPAKPVKAAGALGAQQAIDMLQILYSALASGMMVSGAVNADFTDAETGAELFEEFMDTLCDCAGLPSYEIPSYMYGTTFTMKDGTVYTLTDCANYVKVLEDPTETEPDVEMAPGTWGKLGMTYAEWLEMQLEELQPGSSGEEPEQDPLPDPEISGFKIATGFFGMMSDIISDIFNGETEVTDPKGYFQDVHTYDGSYNSQNAYWYVNYLVITDKKSYLKYEKYVSNYTQGYFVGFVRTASYPENRGDYLELKYYQDGTCRTNYANTTCTTSYSTDPTVTTEAHAINSVYSGKNDIVSTNLPIFTSEDAMVNFYSKQDNSGVLNKPKLNVADLIGNGVTGSLCIFEGKQLKPETFSDTYKAIDNAYDTQIAPQITDDPVANTDLFNQVMTTTTTEVAANSEVAPETDPVTDPGTGTETDNENIDNYKTDLTMIFPFCLPFDFIDLLNVLDAEPIAPKFEIPFVVQALNINQVVTIDMSFMETVMEIFRMGEVILFILLLIKASSKLIRW